MRDEKMKYTLGDLIKFNTISDDSDYASNRFGVETQNDWFDVQVYVEDLFGEIVSKKRNKYTLQVISAYGEKLPFFYEIVNNQIKGELEKLIDKKNRYGIYLYQIFEGSNIRTISDFKTIKKLKHITLIKKNEYIPITKPPKHSKPVYIRYKNPKDTGNVTFARFVNGKWLNTEDDLEEPNSEYFNFWNKTHNMIYKDGIVRCTCCKKNLKNK